MVGNCPGGNCPGVNCWEGEGKERGGDGEGKSYLLNFEKAT